jgi:outer membrane protein OmpA-like peptidoglycan-associated protein
MDPHFAAARRFDSERQIVERHAVFFKTASADVNPEVLWPIANDLRALFEAATAAGRRVNVAVMGWTDPFGPDALNARLGQERADRVAAELGRQGVPAEFLVAKASGVGLQGDASRQIPWYGRRVSFQVVVGP